MRRFQNTGLIGIRIAQRIMDRFLSRGDKDRSGGTARASRLGTVHVESLESRQLLSAAPLTVHDFLASSFYESTQETGTDGLEIDRNAYRLGFDGDTSKYLGDSGVFLGDATPTGTSYMLYDYWGGAWSDAEKTPQNNEDDYLCWAAAASNVLEWTGWGQVDGMTTTDDMFAYFQNHWTDDGGWMDCGWDWWFDGTNPGQNWGGSQVDVSGGGFYPSENVYDYIHWDFNEQTTMSSINSYLHNGYGVTIGIYYGGG
ncbi:MAG TPA: hypothetical protein VJL29_15350, partial [Thermoguttaceae bacterium]|nr:hypothetical protein [Thermoguttaceae bacterium]